MIMFFKEILLLSSSSFQTFPDFLKKWVLFFVFGSSMSLFSVQAKTQTPPAKLQTEMLYSTVDLYRSHQISREELQQRIIRLQKEFSWNLDQVSYLKDFYKKMLSSDSIWQNPYCQILGLLKTEFYLDYADSLEECTLFRRKKIDFPKFPEEIALMGYTMNSSQLQEAEVGDQDYVIRISAHGKVITSVGPVQEFVLRTQNAEELAEEKIPLATRNAWEDLPSEKSLQTTTRKESWMESKHVAWGLGLLVGAVACDFFQKNQVSFQY